MTNDVENILLPAGYTDKEIKSNSNLVEETEAILREMGIFIERAKGHSFIGFCICNDRPLRQRIYDVLKNRLGTELSFHREELIEGVDICDTLMDANLSDNAVVFIDKIDEFPLKTIRYLNFSRERLSEIKKPIIFWTDRRTMDQIVKEAPDLYARSTKQFEFKFETKLSKIEELSDELIKMTIKRRCVLFIGAGVSMEAGLPSGIQIKQKLAESIDYRLEPTDSFFRVAQMVEEIKGRTALIETLRAMAYRDTPGKSHFIIAKLAKSGYFDVILTTNYDFLIEKALEQERCDYDLITDDVSLIFSQNRVKVIKLHGDMRDPESLVITEKDYEDFFEKQKKKAVMDFLRVLHVNNSYIYIGCSMKDTQFNQILKKMHRNLGEFNQVGYMVKPIPSEYMDEELKRIDKIREEMNIREVIPLESHIFFRGLEARLDSLRERLDSTEQNLIKNVEACVRAEFESCSHVFHYKDHETHVERKLEQILFSPIMDNLRNHEIFLLLLAVWLHDTGKIIDPDNIANHQERVNDFILKNQVMVRLSLSKEVIDFVADICKYHGYMDALEITNVEDHVKVDGRKVRKRMLVALLRFANLTSFSYIFPPFQRTLQENILLHNQLWLRHNILKGVNIDHENRMVSLEVGLHESLLQPDNLPWINNILKQHLINPFQEELEKVKDELRNIGIILERVKLKELKSPGSFNPQQKYDDLTILMSMFFGVEHSSGSKVTTNIIETILKAAGDVRNESDLEQERFLEWAEKFLEQMVNMRPTTVDKLNTLLINIKNSSIAIQEKIERIIAELTQLYEYKQIATAKIGEKISQDLIEKGDKIVIFGNSNTIYSTLEKVIDKKDIEVVIMECRHSISFTKERFFLKTEKLALRIKDLGYRVTFMSDISLPHFFYECDEKERIKILMGCTLIHPKDRFVVNTIGSLAVAMMARQLGISFYVAGIRWKIFEKEKEEILNEISGFNLLLPEEKLQQFMDKGIILKNPASDIIPFGLITNIITEDGIFLPDKVLEERSDGMLSKYSYIS